MPRWGANRRAAGIGQAASVGLGVLAALLPKCPLCWAAYGTMACTFGLAGILRWDRLFPAVVGLFLLNLLMLGRAARVSGRYAPFLLSLAGSLAVLAGRWGGARPPLAVLGSALLLASALWNLNSRSRPAALGGNPERAPAAGLSA